MQAALKWVGRVVLTVFVAVVIVLALTVSSLWARAQPKEH